MQGRPQIGHFGSRSDVGVCMEVSLSNPMLHLISGSDVGVCMGADLFCMSSVIVFHRSLWCMCERGKIHSFPSGARIAGKLYDRDRL